MNRFDGMENTYGLIQLTRDDLDKKPRDIKKEVQELEPIKEESESSEEEIDLDYIINNCPKTEIVRKFMKENLKNNDEPIWL